MMNCAVSVSRFSRAHLVDKGAEVALEAPAALHESHEGVEVRLAAPAPDGPALPKVHNLRGWPRHRQTRHRDGAGGRVTDRQITGMAQLA
eukprot:1194270-Prorocentrum_minimum.AAC.1